MDTSKLDWYERERAEGMLSILESLLEQGALDKSHLSGRILDFGAGRGTHIPVLAAYGGYVDALDKDEVVLQARERELLPPERVHQTEGLAYLQKNPSTYDFIAGLMVGPVLDDNDIRFIRKLRTSAEIALKDNGVILLHSNPFDMCFVGRALPDGPWYGIPGGIVYLSRKGDKIHVPSLLERICAYF